MSKSRSQKLIHPLRLYSVLGSLAFGAGLLLWRAFDMQVLDNDFLQGQGDARHLRNVGLVAHRGMITDRNGEPLAISTPVDSVWAVPSELMTAKARWPELARLLGMRHADLKKRVERRLDSEFVYIKRHVSPDLSAMVMALKLPGVSLQREYKRYYPAGEVAGHVLGFTNIDDVGQEGIELAYNDWLTGLPGSKRVIKDRYGRIVEDVESVREPEPGNSLALSLDRSVQYLAYRELKSAVRRYKARSGSMVIMDAHNGEVLAMVNQPSFNPNNRRTLTRGAARNRAVTDLFEPGSTIKPFTVAAALESGRYQSSSKIDTSPGFFKVGSSVVRDLRDYGVIDMQTLLQKSSNIGASKLALGIEPEQLWRVFNRVGFGVNTGSGFPGEATGLLGGYEAWRDIERATLSYGYGVSVTPLQLARAYAVLANKGCMPEVSLVVGAEHSCAEPALKEKTVTHVLAMLESVVRKGGTGTRAAVPGYRVSGKTGTIQKLHKGRYSDEHYVAMFAGVVPASRPRLVGVVVINEPGEDQFYGGQVAAPVFGGAMAGALRMLGIAPDERREGKLQQASISNVMPSVIGGDISSYTPSDIPSYTHSEVM